MFEGSQSHTSSSFDREEKRLFILLGRPTWAGSKTIVIIMTCVFLTRLSPLRLAEFYVLLPEREKKRLWCSHPLAGILLAKLIIFDNVIANISRAVKEGKDEHTKLFLRACTHIFWKLFLWTFLRVWEIFYVSTLFQQQRARLIKSPSKFFRRTSNLISLSPFVHIYWSSLHACWLSRFFFRALESASLSHIFAGLPTTSLSLVIAINQVEQCKTLWNLHTRRVIFCVLDQRDYHRWTLRTCVIEIPGKKKAETLPF